MLQPWWRIVLLKRSRGEHYLVTATCSLATLQGTYLFAYDGIVIEDNGMHTLAGVGGQEVYNGAGTMTGVYSIRATKNPDGLSALWRSPGWRSCCS